MLLIETWVLQLCNYGKEGGEKYLFVQWPEYPCIMHISYRIS
jgi:hypothetical protein